MRVLEFNHTRIAVELDLEECKELALTCRGNSCHPLIKEIKFKLEQYVDLVAADKKRQSNELLNLRARLEKEKDMKELHKLD